MVHPRRLSWFLDVARENLLRYWRNNKQAVYIFKYSNYPLLSSEFDVMGDRLRKAGIV